VGRQNARVQMRKEPHDPRIKLIHKMDHIRLDFSEDLFQFGFDSENLPWGSQKIYFAEGGQSKKSITRGKRAHQKVCQKKSLVPLRTQKRIGGPKDLLLPVCIT